MIGIDVLNRVKFTDDDGIMHLFTPEEQGRESLLRFRYLLTKIEYHTGPGYKHLHVLEKGQTFADAFDNSSIQENLYTLEGANRDFKISIWSPDLLEGMSIENFFGDEKAWEKNAEDWSKINCINDVGWTRETVKIVNGGRFK